MGWRFRFGGLGEKLPVPSDARQAERSQQRRQDGDIGGLALDQGTGQQDVVAGDVGVSVR